MQCYRSMYAHISSLQAIQSINQFMNRNIIKWSRRRVSRKLIETMRRSFFHSFCHRSSVSAWNISAWLKIDSQKRMFTNAITLTKMFSFRSRRINRNCVMKSVSFFHEKMPTMSIHYGVVGLHNEEATGMRQLLLLHVIACAIFIHTNQKEINTSVWVCLSSHTHSAVHASAGTRKHQQNKKYEGDKYCRKCVCILNRFGHAYEFRVTRGITSRKNEIAD